MLLALLVYGFRARDQRAQYVALLLFAYAVLLALLAFAASQGATLASAWLMLLAVGFGVLLAALLLFGWGLRAEGAKAAGLVTLLLTLLVLPLVVTLNTVNLGGSDDHKDHRAFGLWAKRRRANRLCRTIVCTSNHGIGTIRRDARGSPGSSCCR